MKTAYEFCEGCKHFKTEVVTQDRYGALYEKVCEREIEPVWCEDEEAWDCELYYGVEEP